MPDVVVTQIRELERSVAVLEHRQGSIEDRVLAALADTRKSQDAAAAEFAEFRKDLGAARIEIAAATAAAAASATAAEASATAAISAVTAAGGSLTQADLDRVRTEILNATLAATRAPWWVEQLTISKVGTLLVLVSGLLGLFTPAAISIVSAVRGEVVPYAPMPIQVPGQAVPTGLPQSDPATPNPDAFPPN